MLFNQNAIEDGAAGSYQITNSLRFSRASSTYLIRTTTSITPTSNNTYTASLWLKRGSLGALSSIVAAATNDGSSKGLDFNATDNLKVGTTVSTQVFRDTSSWYHIVISVSAGVGTVYVNNDTILTGVNPALNITNGINNYFLIGSSVYGGSQFFDGYITNVHFVDGQALLPSDFAESDADTGQWKAKAYTGTYGNRGFRLTFSSGTSTATLGNDSSGNANNFTLVNFVRSNSTSDCWVKDVPSGNGGSSGSRPNGNYCVLNPLDKQTTSVLAGGNLETTLVAAQAAIGSIGMDSGKWYWEVRMNTNNTTKSIGVYGSSAVTASYTSTVITDVGVRFDRDAGTLDYTTDGTSWTSIATGLTSGTYFPYFSSATNAKNIYVNFGQRSFSFTPPSGYVSLCTANLPDSSIKDGNLFMDVLTWTGTNAARSITTPSGFSPDLVWIKNRNTTAYNNTLSDTVRGAQKTLSSNTTAIEATNAQAVSAFNSNGFSLGTDQTVNKTAINYVGWMWDAGSSTVTNTSGTVSAQVRANPTSGVSVITWTSPASGANSVGHGLGVAPSLVIIKQRGNVDNWYTYHKSLGAGKHILLNSNSIPSTSSAYFPSSPSSSVINLGTSVINTNPYVGYAFAEVPGFSKFGSYTGNGLADGTFVYCGFRPRFILIRRTDALGDWHIQDTARSPYNASIEVLYPNQTALETSIYGNIDILSNGFKLRGTDVGENGSAVPYIFAAFAENPFKNANAR